MKQGWKLMKLGEIFEIERGGSPRPISSYLTHDADGINWIKIGDTKGITKYIYKTEEKIRPEGVKKSRLVHEGDFILSNSMSFGRPYIMKTTGCIHDGWLVLRDKTGNTDQNYLYYVLSSDLIFQQFDYLAAGATVRNLNIGLVKSVAIPVPPLAEQQRIVAVLDEAFAAIDVAKANAEKNLQNARELFETYLNNIFANPGEGWKVCELGDYIHFIDYRGKTPKKTQSGIRLITAKNVKNGFLRVEPQEFIDPTSYDKWMTRGIPKQGDVLFTTEAPLANVAQLDTNEKVAFAQRIIILQPQLDKIDQTFLKYMLLSKPIRNNILANGTGATVQGIKASLLRKIKIYFPGNISDQRKIVAKLDVLLEKVEWLEIEYQHKLEQLEELKKSLMQKAFNGELTEG